MRLALLAAVLCCLTACGTDFRAEPMPRAQAQLDGRPRTLIVVKVHDLVGPGMGGYRDENVSHLIECDDVSNGGKAPVTLPYSDWNTGKAPPQIGDRLVVSPADWVLRARDTQGRPFGR